MTILRTALRLYLAGAKSPSIGQMHNERRYYAARWASFASFKVAALATINWVYVNRAEEQCNASCTRVRSTTTAPSDSNLLNFS